MADFYGTATGYKAYHLARGRIAIEDDDEIEVALLIASEWIDGCYLSSFNGYKVGQRDQIREWPRTGAYDIYGYPVSYESVPREVENATYEAAQRQLQSPGSLLKDYTPNQYKRVAVDGAISVDYAAFASSSDIQTQFAIIDQILAPLIMTDGNVSNLSGRAVRV